MLICPYLCVVMRNALIYFLLFATLLPTVSPWGIIAHYQLNKKYIARVLCQNRDKPQLHCDGQCYLAKRLKAQQDKQDKETTERVQNTPAIQLFCSDCFAFACTPNWWVGHDRTVFTYLIPIYTAPQSAVFHPPGIHC
ncbi:hypothetical protein GCM10028806_08790 [Spirosoma terrae]